MNEKFFDLKKEKQDRMMNGALAIFAKNGYRHASTDDIVKEAGISKGLLFHYFISKIGLYEFLYDYSVRYVKLELSTSVQGEGTDFFEMLEQIYACELQVMKTYPYMISFLKESRKETDAEALKVIEEKRNVLSGQYEQLLERSDRSHLKAEVDMDKLYRMISFTVNGLMEEWFVGDTFRPDSFFKELKQYLAMVKKLSYREE